MANPITKRTSADKQALTNKSVYTLPDNPSNKGYSADQIKGKIADPAFLVFDWLKQLSEEVYSFYGSYETDNARITSLENGKLDKITNSLSSGDVAAYVVNNNNGSYSQAYMKIVGITATAWTIPSRRANGELVVGAPTDNAHAVNLSYANSHYAPKITASDKVYGTDELGAQKAFDVDEDFVADGKIVRRNTSTGTIVVGTPTSNTHAVTKAYADNLVKRTNLVSIIGEATNAISGLLSATDKARLDTLYALLSTDDDNSFVDTIGEVLAIFSNYPEGTTILNYLAQKVNVSDIIDNLTTESAILPLSAKQGKILKDNLDDRYTKAEDEAMVLQKIANVNTMNVIVDQDNSENYTFQIKIQNGKAHFIATKVE